MLASLDNAVNLAERVGLYIIIDNHGYLGKNFYDSDRVLMTSVFGQLAQRYADRSDKLIYELFNEPHEKEYFKNTLTLNDVQNEWIAAIRKHDTRHSVIVTGDGCSIDNLADCVFSDRNLIYTFHFYGPFLFTHQGADWLDLKLLESPIPFPYDSDTMPDKPSGLDINEAAFDEYPEIGNVKYIEDRIQVAVDFAKERNVPIFCGEWGVLNKLTEQEDYCYYHKTVGEIFEKNDIAWTLWAYRDDFSIFNREGGYLVENNLNLGLLSALGLTVPADYGSMFQTQIMFYDDYVATFAKPASYNYEATISFASTTSPYSGNRCIEWIVGGNYASVTCEIWPVIDLTVQAAKDYVLSFMIKTDDAIAEPGLTVRFSEYDETLENPIPWRYGVTVDNRSFASDGEWHEVRLPMSWFGNMGANTEAAVPSRPCDWKHINKLEFAAEGNTDLKNAAIFIDQVKLVDKAHINTMDRIPKEESWWW
jgi:endoglucanase